MRADRLIYNDVALRGCRKPQSRGLKTAGSTG